MIEVCHKGNTEGSDSFPWKGSEYVKTQTRVYIDLSILLYSQMQDFGMEVAVAGVRCGPW